MKKNGKRSGLNTLAILQARMSSSRLPGKVMKKILGKPLLALQIERINRSVKIDHLIVATSINREDDRIQALCETLGVECFRGNLANVLDRFYMACKSFEPRTIVRLTGDCPLTDPEKIDDLITFFQKNDYDYAANCIRYCLPHGLDAEIFSTSALETAWQNADTAFEKEHVTPYMRQPENNFSVGHMEYDPVISPHLRWCVDEPEDFELVKQIYGALYPRNPDFTTADILGLMEKQPELFHINAAHSRQPA